MTVVFCLDNNNGLLFNNRRQSRDSNVIADIAKITNGDIFITPFSEELFKNFGGNVKISTDGFKQLNENDFCFSENIDPEALKNQITQIVVYFWNRSYPADFFCTLDFNEYELKETKEFEGSSHEKITRKTYGRLP